MSAAPPGEIPDVLLPTYMVKSLGAMKAPHAVKRITFDKSDANPGETLYISVPKLNDEVLVPGSLALRFDIDLEGGHVNNSPHSRRYAGACQQAGCKVCGHHFARHGEL